MDEPVGRVDPEGLQEGDTPAKSNNDESGEGSWYDDIPIVGPAIQWLRQLQATDKVEKTKETANEVLKRKYQTGQGSWDEIESSLDEFEQAQLKNLKEAGKTMKSLEGEVIDRLPNPSR